MEGQNATYSQSLVPSAGDPNYNPFSDSTRVSEMKLSQDQLKQQRQEYYSQSIIQKSDTQQNRKPRLINAQIKRETDELHNSAKQNPVQPNDQLPEPFRVRKREGVKAYIERQRQISRVLYNTSIKQVEIQNLSDSLEKENYLLNKRELVINQQIKQIDAFLIDIKHKAMEDANINKQGREKLELVKRKSDELKNCLGAIYQEIARQNTLLKYHISCRDVIEAVAAHCVQAQQVSESREARRRFVEELDKRALEFAEARQQQVVSQISCQSTNATATSTKQPQKYVPRYKRAQVAASSQLSSQASKQPVPLAQYFSHRQIQVLAEQLCQFTGQSTEQQDVPLLINFDFDAFVGGLNIKMEQVFKNKLLENLQMTQTQGQLAGKQYDYEFERLRPNEFTQINTAAAESIELLRQTAAQEQSIPFQSAQEFISNLNLLETSNLVKTQHLQDLETMCEKERNNYLQVERQCSEQELSLQQQKEDLESKIEVIQQQINSIFNKENYDNSVEAFIYDLDQFGSQDELMFQKYSDELSVIQQAVATAGAYCGAIGNDLDDLNMQSTIILGKMELLLNGTINKLKAYKQSEFQSARRELTKNRREMTRATKYKEMSEQKEKDAKKQQLRDEKARHIVPVQKQVFARSFVAPQKKTQKQIDLENKLKQKQFEDENYQANFYEDE